MFSLWRALITVLKLPNNATVATTRDIEEILKELRFLREEIGNIKEKLAAPVNINQPDDLKKTQYQVDLAKAQKELKETQRGRRLFENPRLTWTIVGLLGAVLLVIFIPQLIAVYSNPDQKKVNEGYESLGEIMTYIKNLEDKNKRDDQQDAAIQNLSDRIDHLKPSGNDSQKIDITVKGSQPDLLKSQPEPSKKAIGIINVDASSH